MKQHVKESTDTDFVADILIFLLMCALVALAGHLLLVVLSACQLIGGAL